MIPICTVMDRLGGLARADAHPFSCMLDQHKEAQRFDPSGNYVRRWLPVLSRLPNTWIHRRAPPPALPPTLATTHPPRPSRPVISVVDLFRSRLLTLPLSVPCVVVPSSLKWVIGGTFCTLERLIRSSCNADHVCMAHGH